ncbi:MAG TPA: nuclear transport factor 2 family protein [Candidatus Xenobia bacterium]|jgi:hypothetical protein
MKAWIAASLLLCAPALADVANGGFSGPHRPVPSPRAPITEGDLASWRVVSGPVYWLNFPHCSAHSIELGPGAEVAQSVPTEPGVRYVLRFLLYTNYQPPTLKTVEVTAGDQHVEFSDDAARELRAAHTWKDEQVVFTASGPVTDLSWRGEGAPGDGPYITDVWLAPYRPDQQDDIDIRRRYTQIVRAVQERAALDVYRLQTPDYRFVPRQGPPVSRLDFNVDIHDMLAGEPDTQITVLDVRPNGAAMEATIDESLDYNDHGKRVHDEGRQVDTWVRTPEGWKLSLTKELAPTGAASP